MLMPLQQPHPFHRLPNHLDDPLRELLKVETMFEAQAFFQVKFRFKGGFVGGFPVRL